ncbi:hypothetical protein ACEZCY_27705 [Streptacidiphilus sp. N1-12]|uniref:Uncharacterized protein n=2 Tax=Streptacidiphilus alkalitolerans TaxID=3342712 RepID=A0ABV6VGD1_9ACTN
MPSTAPTPDSAPLVEAGRCLDELDRALRAAQAGLGSGLDVRRVRTDLVHLRESLALLCDAAAAGAAQDPAPASAWAPRPQGMVDVPDTPYDPAMWRDADDEGIGCRHR